MMGGLLGTARALNVYSQNHSSSPDFAANMELLIVDHTSHPSRSQNLLLKEEEVLSKIRATMSVHKIVVL